MKKSIVKIFIAVFIVVLLVFYSTYKSNKLKSIRSFKDSYELVEENKIKQNEPQLDISGSDKEENIQEKDGVLTVNTTAVMAVYPGCENEAKKGKQQATDCLSKKLGAEIGDELQDFANSAASDGLSGAVAAKLSFQIDTNGRIINISSQGDEKLGLEAKKALQRITDRQYKRGKLIKPAETEDGRPAKLNFSIPVKMMIE